MFITPAYAQAAGSSAGVNEIFMQLFPFVLIMVIMWFLILRPQRQQQKRHAEALSGIRRGDTIVTGGGMIGKVSKVVSETELEVEIADGVKIRVVRSLVTDVRAKGEPAKDKE